jgi:hypothetical protein
MYFLVATTAILLAQVQIEKVDKVDNRVLHVSVWRDFSPPNPPTGILAIVDVLNIRPTKIKVVNLRTKQVWATSLKFLINLEENPTKGQRYFVVNDGPAWLLGDPVQVQIFANRRWLIAGEAKIKSTH